MLFVVCHVLFVVVFVVWLSLFVVFCFGVVFDSCSLSFVCYCGVAWCVLLVCVCWPVFFVVGGVCCVLFVVMFDVFVCVVVCYLCARLWFVVCVVMFVGRCVLLSSAIRCWFLRFVF